MESTILKIELFQGVPTDKKAIRNGHPAQVVIVYFFIIISYHNVIIP